MSKLMFTAIRNRASLPRISGVSCFHNSAPRREIFKIQDEADFKEKVLKNKKLVILDFYAT